MIFHATGENLIDILGTLLVPSGWVAVLLVLAIVLFPFTRLRRLAQWALVVAALVYGIFGLGPIAHALLGPLERAYPPLTDPSSLHNVDTIVVLTGYASPNPAMPATDQLNPSSMYRLMHAIWMTAQSEGPRILVSGSGDSARVMREVTVLLGVPGERVLLDDGAGDTGRSAEWIRRSGRVGQCVLVTSAGHMPRAMGVFRKQGVDCVPAPTEFYSTYPLGLFDFIPGPRNLAVSDLAVHEYLGLAWYRLGGRI